MPIPVPTATSKAKKHYFIAPHALYVPEVIDKAPLPSWGHVGPSIALSNNLLSLNTSIVVTLLVPAALTEAAKTEFARYPTQKQRLHIVHTLVKDANKLANEAAIRSSGALMTLDRAAEMFEPAVRSLTAAHKRLRSTRKTQIWY